MMAMIYNTSDVAGPREYGVRARRVNRVDAFWLVLDGNDPTLPFTVSLPDGREAIAVFSSEDEAMMFCRFGMEGDNPTIRKINTAEILSLLLCPSPRAKHVTLDPTPEILGGRLLELLTLDGERFGRSFAGPGSEPVARSPYT